MHICGKKLYLHFLQHIYRGFSKFQESFVISTAVDMFGVALLENLNVRLQFLYSNFRNK